MVASATLYAASAAGRAFQSPSLRGSGRFKTGCAAPHAFRLVLIPFIAGQWSLRAARLGGELAEERVFQSPSLRGSGRFGPTLSRSKKGWTRVSIPFIAGQWSLQGDAESLVQRLRKFQSPSLRGSGRFEKTLVEAIRKALSFNPLHCGAVVASRTMEIVWIAAAAFQSPSLRGSGRFSWKGTRPSAASSFNPLHCGAVVASYAALAARAHVRRFQSPSLRGSGRFDEPTLVRALRRALFQSPSLRGSGRFRGGNPPAEMR